MTLILAASCGGESAAATGSSTPSAHVYGLFAIGEGDSRITLSDTLTRIAESVGWLVATTWVVLRREGYSTTRLRWQTGRLVHAGWYLVSDASPTLVRTGSVVDAVGDLDSIEVMSFDLCVTHALSTHALPEMFTASDLGVAADPREERRQTYWAAVHPLLLATEGIVAQHSSTTEGVPGLHVFSSRALPWPRLQKAGVIDGHCGVLSDAWEFPPQLLLSAAGMSPRSESDKQAR